MYLYEIIVIDEVHYSIVIILIEKQTKTCTHNWKLLCIYIKRWKIDDVT